MKKWSVCLCVFLCATAAGQAQAPQDHAGTGSGERTEDPGQTPREELAARYPNIAEGSDEPENKKVMCPFLRMLTRAGLFDEERAAQKGNKGPKGERLTVGVNKITTAAGEFGCPAAGCGLVALLTSQFQVGSGTSKWYSVNLESLHTAGAISHECGLTYALGGTEVDDGVRRETLAQLESLADEDGRLSFDDLNSVKLAICRAQGVPNSLPGDIEVGLIYTFLGGNRRGYIDYADVERFLHAELPKTIGFPGAAKR